MASEVAPQAGAAPPLAGSSHMVDYFSLLDVPRRPWLEPEALKQKFFARSAESHPDRWHQGTPEERQSAQEHYTGLNAAYQCLRHEKGRLAHLLELESGARPTDLHQVPADLMNRSLEITSLCRSADAVLAEKAAATSPLLKVQLFQRSQLALENVQAHLQQLNSWRETLLAELKTLDARWPNLPRDGSPERLAALQRLQELYRLFGFCSRWLQQLQERASQLCF
jgi:hypothetical protein